LRPLSPTNANGFASATPTTLNECATALEKPATTYTMKTTDEVKDIPAGASAVEVAKILGCGLWLFESKPGRVVYYRVLEVSGMAVYDIGGDGSDVDEVAFIRGGQARGATPDLSPQED
jgi:hypothetical protein